jgi:hypothetical protein
MSIDLSQEPPVRLEQIARETNHHFSTVFRWVLRGVRGPDGRMVKLQALRLGGKYITSREALQRFAEATTPNELLDNGRPRITRRSPAQRQKASERAERELREMGI